MACRFNPKAFAPGPFPFAQHGFLRIQAIFYKGTGSAMYLESWTGFFNKNTSLQRNIQIGINKFQIKAVVGYTPFSLIEQPGKNTYGCAEKIDCLVDQVNPEVENCSAALSLLVLPGSS